MTITLEIRPEVQAAASGRPLEAHAATLLERAVRLPSIAPQSGLGKRLVEVCAMAAGLTGDTVRSPSPWRPLELA